MEHNIAWFDVPVSDLSRAMTFYTAVLGAPVKLNKSGSIPLGILPTPKGGQMGCLVPNGPVKPASDGVMVWFSCEGRFRAAVSAAKKNGGTILGEIHAIGGFGFRAEVLDSEGNRIALYSETDT